MHPALSVIVFTTFSGAGYGLLALLGILGAFQLLPTTAFFGGLGLGTALALISVGLLSSTLHLGRPERAWRAFSQWRSSWLSREGIASVLTYVPAGVFGVGWVLLQRTDGIFALAGILAAVAAGVTVFATGMIYASLKPIAQWASPYTTPVYMILAIMTGAMLLQAFCVLMGGPAALAGWMALLSTLGGWALKAGAWRHNRRKSPIATANSATGLGKGTVRSLEWPHTERNYLLKEMGHHIARKHADRIRSFVHIAGFALPALLTIVTMAISALAMSGWPAAFAALLALIFQVLGVLAERWLFFAEAEHTVILYYQR